MSVYDFRCSECGEVTRNVFLPMDHADSDHPSCCGQQTAHHHTKMGMVHWKDYQLPDGGFVAHSMPGKPVITSVKENKEMMRRHGLVDANEYYSGTENPTKAGDMQKHADDMKSIDAITPTDSEMRQLKSDGVINADGDLITA